MMTRPRALVRVLTGAVGLAALFASALIPSAAAVVQSGDCGLSTLHATIRVADDGTLTCGPGEAVRTLDDLARPNPGRLSTRQAMLSFLAMADFGIVDEESPLRAEWLDKCRAPAGSSTFRPHETMIPALVNAHIEAATALASTPGGSPVLHKNYDFAIGLGSAADNKQLNELRWFIELLDGSTLVDADSGSDGYEGVQGADPRGGAPGLQSPVTGSTLRDLANEPFYAAGLRAFGGPLPWFSVLGNHDVKNWGTAPDDNPAWETFAQAWATGALKLNDVGSQHVARACEDPTALTDPAFWTAVATDLGSSRVVTPDADRRPLERSEWIEEHSTTSGLPQAHGFERARCTNANGEELARGCYSWNQDPFHFVVLDTTPSGGFDNGNIDAAQLAWLERDLKANSSRYFKPSGKEERTRNGDRIVVVFQHHPTAQLDNTTPSLEGGEVVTGEALEALLLRFPNVVLQMTGHSRVNRVAPHEHAEHKTGYWEIQTTSIADWPSQSRSIEVADNHDGTLSIVSVMVDAATPPNARAIDWRRDDPSNEKALGASRSVNEDWLASAAREIALNDPQALENAAGDAADRNVELLVRNPLGVTPPAGPGIRPPIDIPDFPVPTFPGFQPPPFPSGFPGGFPQPTLPPAIPTPTITSPLLPHLTGPGLAVRPSSAGGWGAKALPLLLIATAGALWLTRARVRRWMVGI